MKSHNQTASRILIVDDEPHLRELLVDVLDDTNIEIEVASSGQEALAKARRHRPDLLVTDLMLGDCTGLDVIDSLRDDGEDIPAVIITGNRDPEALAQSCRRRPVEFLTKPLDIEQLRSAVTGELSRQASHRRATRRRRQLRRLARKSNIQKKQFRRELDAMSSDMDDAYRSINSQMEVAQHLVKYQQHLIGATNDDQVFEQLFRMFASCSGPIFGVAMVCDAEAQLQVAGRFGVPIPDGVGFCQAIADPMIDMVLTDARCLELDAFDHRDQFDQSIQRYLPGITILAIPLIPAEGELIGLVVLYRKGEQPFEDDDMKLAELLACSTAVAIRRTS